MGQYKYHVFVCVSGKTCGKDGGQRTKDVLKKAAKAAGLGETVRVNEAGCMNQCGHGPMVVVYPQDIWYAGVDAEGARRIVAEHLVDGRAVERYRYVAPPGDNKVK
jgi:(2Fe-2S) ferredoxin